MEKYIDIDNVIYRVEKMSKENEFKKGYAYITKFKYKDKKIILPFFGNTLEKRNKPGIYINGIGENSELIIRRPLKSKDIKEYLEDNIYSLTPSTIENIIKTEGIKSAKDMEIMLADSDDIFAPNINDDDNGLQELIKRVLKIKNINLKNYSSRFDSPSDLNNTKRALLCHGKMSFEKFIKWCTVLDLSFDIIIKDTKLSIQPMGKNIEIKYSYNK